MASAGEEPERLLSAALHAQASGGSSPAPQRPAPRKRLPVVRVLLFAVVLGFVAGAVIGVFTL